MFKSGGYFKGVSCPFYLRGGCPRVYCPFRHAKPATVSACQGALQSSQSGGCTDHTELHRAMLQHGPRQVHARCPAHWPRDIVLPNNEELMGTGEAGPSEGNFPLDDIITASDWASSLSSREGKFPSTSEKATYSTSTRKTPSLQAGPYSAVVSHPEATPLTQDNAKEVSSAMVRDIFGSGSEDETESLSFLDDVPGDGSRDKVGGSKGEVGGSKPEMGETRSGTSDDDFEQFVRSEVASGEQEVKRQAAAEELFTRVLSGLNGDGSGGRVRGRGSSTDSALTKYSNQGMRSKRKAHPNAGTLRDPAVAVPAVTKSRSIQSNFSEQLADPEAVFTNQKRLSHYKQQESQSNQSNVVQRPRLKTTVNAKIPTALRQKFLDGFVDEHLKMADTAQGAYQQAVVEEAALEQRSRSRMLYINLAGNHLRALRERAGDGRGTTPGASTEPTSTGVDRSRQPEQSRAGAKRVTKVAPPPSKARKMDVAGSGLPLDALMPAGGCSVVGRVDKQLLPASGEGGLLSTATSSAVGKTPGGKGKAPVAAKVQEKCAKHKAAPKGTQSAGNSVATVGGSAAVMGGSVATVGSSVATVGGGVASVKSSSKLQEMFGSDSDSEGWEEHDSWDQAMTVSDRATSRGSVRTITVKKSKAKAVSQASGTKEGVGQVTPRPHPTAKKNWSVVPTTQPEELTEEVFCHLLASHVLSEEELMKNSYPRPTGLEGEAFINQEVDPSLQPTPCGANAERHRCCRCGQPFLVYENGRYQDVDECVYHYGKLRKHRDAAQGMVLQFSCCGEPRGAAGCQVAQMHVTAGWRQEREVGFVETGLSEDSAQNTRVLALDCEMCYTTVGLELARVTVVDMQCETVYDTLVRPAHPIVDYNTRFSGLTAHDFTSDVTTSLTDVQAQLLSMVSMETILLGHSLDSDLRSLKVVHSRVVDTALVFPHRLGPPYKKALKTLAALHLGKIIQDSAEGGHDCAEDARCCMQLMLKKARSDHLQSLRARRVSGLVLPATASSSAGDTTREQGMNL